DPDGQGLDRQRRPFPAGDAGGTVWRRLRRLARHSRPRRNGRRPHGRDGGGGALPAEDRDADRRQRPFPLLLQRQRQDDDPLDPDEQRPRPRTGPPRAGPDRRRRRQLLNELPEAGLVQYLGPELLGFGELRAGVLAGDDIVGFFRDRVDDLAAGAFDQRRRL